MADNLSRKQMEKVIEEGGSVLVEGRIITKVADLPDDEESIEQAAAELEERKTKAEEAKTAKGSKGKK